MGLMNTFHVGLSVFVAVVAAAMLVTAAVVLSKCTRHALTTEDSSQVPACTVFCFWTGKNSMSNARSACLNQLRTAANANVVLVTFETLPKYVLKSDPLHPAYQYLSETHRSDYLRAYFMHFHGGGYSDVKETTGDWMPAFQQLQDSDKWTAGYPENPGGADYKRYGHIVYNHEDLVGNGAFICKPRTPLTTEWYAGVLKIMDKNMEQLKQYPSTHPQDCADHGNSNYPLVWGVFNRIFHEISFKYKDKLLRVLPTPVLENYR